MEDETIKEMKNRIESLESGGEVLTAKINEVIACLEDNKITRTVGVEYLYKDESEGEAEAEEEAEAEAEEETPVEE